MGEDMKRRDRRGEHLQGGKIAAAFLLLLAAVMLLYHTIREEDGLWGKQEDSGIEEEQEEEDIHDIGNRPGKRGAVREKESLVWKEYVTWLSEIWSNGRDLGRHPFLCILSVFLGTFWELWKTFQGALFWLL
ncbi:MAG: hypothetical protein HFI32_04520 [Lachnospiraceae bacterium]|nr:hypothetical protein [Lachnospiraceae bacterium]